MIEVLKLLGKIIAILAVAVLCAIIIWISLDVVKVVSAVLITIFIAVVAVILIWLVWMDGDV